MIIIYIVGILLLMPFILAIIRGSYDGITGKEKYKHLYVLDMLETIEDNEQQKIEDDITHYQVLIARNKEIALNLEKELEYTTDIKKRSVILSKLNTIDNKTYTYTKKIDKLLEKSD